VLAPSYDVISAQQRDELYAHDLRNVVRVDFGKPMPEDVPGAHDVYTRAAAHLRSWLDLGIVVQDEKPSIYVTDHEFATPDGAIKHRRGLLARVPARSWGESEVLPHEHTLRGPKEDRLALMRAARTQTSPVWALWDRAFGLSDVLENVTAGPALLSGRTESEVAAERHGLWRIDDPPAVAGIVEALAPSRLYIADGHHRFETAAAYAAERRTAGDRGDDDSQFALLYLCGADDPALVVQPTHRLVLPRPGLPYSRDDLLYRLDDAWEMEPADSMVQALDVITRERGARHAFALAAPDGIAVLSSEFHEESSPAQRLDVAVLAAEILERCGVGKSELTEGALRYSRDPAEVEAAVRRGEAALGFCVNPCTTSEVLTVADAGEVMPQKSTYFSPKVPTGLILSPL